MDHDFPFRVRVVESMPPDTLFIMPRRLRGESDDDWFRRCAVIKNVGPNSLINYRGDTMTVITAEGFVPDLPWRADGLDGFSTSHGHTFDGGSFTGGGPHSPQTFAVRLLGGVYGRPATVQVDLCDDRGGRSVTLDPPTARQAAAALIAAADKADAEMAHWRGVVERNRAEVAALMLRDALGRSGAEEAT